MPASQKLAGKSDVGKGSGATSKKVRAADGDVAKRVKDAERDWVKVGKAKAAGDRDPGSDVQRMDKNSRRQTQPKMNPRSPCSPMFERLDANKNGFSTRTK